MGVVMGVAFMVARNGLDQVRRLPLESCCKMFSIAQSIMNGHCQTFSIVEYPSDTPKIELDQLEMIPLETFQDFQHKPKYHEWPLTMKKRTG